MGKKISWSDPLITLEIPNKWPAKKNIPLPNYGLSYGKKSINNNEDKYYLLEKKKERNRI